MKTHLDVELSKKLCPPSKNPYLLALPENLQKQCHWIERAIKPLNKVVYEIDEQTRTLKVVQASASTLKVSWQLYGFIHTEYPPVLEELDTKYLMHDGIIGHTRNQVFRELGYTHMMYDVYKFDTPLAKRLFNGVANQITNPKTAHTKSDIMMQTLKAIDAGEITNDDDSINFFIDIVGADKSKKERQSIFKSIRGHKSKYTNLLTYHCGEGLNSTTEAAKKFNIPYKGDKNHSATNKLGYIPPYGDPITAIRGAKKLIKQYGMQDIEFHFFIDDPKQGQALYKQRKDKLKEFTASVRDEAEWIQTIMLEFGVSKTIDEIFEKLPFKAKGFLPQYLNPEPSKGGLPNEDSIVDVNGVPIGNTNAKIFEFGNSSLPKVGLTG